MDKSKQNHISFHPEIHFSYMMFMEVEQHKMNLQELYERCEWLREKAKATGYTWDNSHFFIDDLCGRPTLKFCIYPVFDNYLISFYNARNNCTVKSFDRVPTQTEIREMLDKIWDDLNLCNKCGEWHKDGKNYSFAGWVCNDCYDENVHLPPDTRGD